MKEKNVFKILGTIVILLLISVIGLFIVKTQKEKSINKFATVEKTTVVTKQLKPMIKGKDASRMKNITSSSKLLMDKLLDYLKSNYTIIFDNTYVVPTGGGLYTIEVPELFRVNGEVYYIDVSNQNLYDISVFPNVWDLGDLGFNLSKNHISKIPNNVAQHKKNFILRDQRIEIYLGSVYKGSTLIEYLPAEFASFFSNLRYKGCEKNIYGRMRFFTDWVGDNEALVTIDNRISMLDGSFVTYTYRVLEPTSTSKPSGGGSAPAGGSSYTYQPTQIYMELKASATVENPDVWEHSKNINISLSGENVNLSNAGIFVNGREIGNNYGNATYRATESGDYGITITYPGLNNMYLNLTIDLIDNENPSYTYTTNMRDGSNYKYLTIVGRDNRLVKSVSVNGSNIYTFDNQNGYIAIPIEYIVRSTGTYRIRVEDMAGNYYENTETIELDITPPKVTNFLVGRRYDSMIGESGGYCTEYCSAKIGSNIFIYLEADEDLGGFDSLLLNRKILEKNNYSLEMGGNAIIIRLELTSNIIAYYGMQGYVEITFNGLRDRWGNKTIFNNNDKLFVKVTKPKISDVIITGGTLSESGDVIEVIKRQTINVTFLTNEKLFGLPIVSVIIPTETSIPGRVYDPLYYEYGRFDKEIIKDDKTYYQYTVELNTSTMVKQIRSKLRGHIRICVENCYDTSGNISDLVIIDKDNKSSNGISLVYGKSEKGALYLAGEQTTRDKITGDINQDGYINDYDYLLLSRHLSEKEEISEEDLLLANVDGNDVIDERDLVELEKLINRRENHIPLNREIKFKAYNEDNEQLTGDTLASIIEEGSDFADVTVENDIITINTKAEKGSIKIKTTYLFENGYEQLTGNTEFEVGEINISNGEFDIISNNNNNRKILGDINGDGYVTLADSRMIQLYLAEFIELSEDQQIVADTFKDNEITIKDATVIQQMSQFSYNGMKKGDRVTLKFSADGETYEDLKDDSIEDQISWYTNSNSDMVTITPNNEQGTAEIIINDNAEEYSKIVIMCKVKINERVEKIAKFNIIVVENIELRLSDTEVLYDLSKPIEEYKVICATTNLTNYPIEWNVSDSTVVKLRKNKLGQIQIVPLKAGTAEITATIDGVSQKCRVNVIETINSIEVEKEKIEIEETLEEIINVTLDPIQPTEIPILGSENENIAKVYKDETTGEYKVLGVQEGNTRIFIASPSNEAVKKYIDVEVTPLEPPVINAISIGQEKTYKPGEKLQIKIKYSEKVIGEAPRLSIGFGEYASKGEPQYVGYEDNNETLVYEYTIQKGDNGILNIYKLTGGNLKDSIGKVDAKLTVDPDYIYAGDKIEAYILEQEENTLEATVTNEEDLKTSQIKNAIKLKTINAATEQIDGESENENEENNYESDLIPVSSGIYRTVEQISTDSEKPQLVIENYTEKYSCWLKEGDIAKVRIKSNEELGNIPSVTMGGKEAQVEGEGKEFYASIPVTKDIEEGYLEVKVNNYKDLAGNDGDELITNWENEEFPIIIDYSGTKIEAVNVGKGEEDNIIYIRVLFSDSNMNRSEYISVTEAPELDIRFDGKKATGKIENNYKEGKYIDSILYTYTISEQDRGRFSINGLTGIVTDIAGNETEFIGTNNIPQISGEEINITESSNNDTNDDEQNQDGQGGNEQNQDGQGGNEQNQDGQGDNEQNQNGQGDNEQNQNGQSGNEQNQDGQSGNEQNQDGQGGNEQNQDGQGGNEQKQAGQSGNKQNQAGQSDNKQSQVVSSNNIKNQEKINTKEINNKQYEGILPKTGKTILNIVGIILGIISLASGILYYRIKKIR